MAARALAAITLLAILGASFPLATSAPSSNPQSPLELGYGPSTLRPLSDGVPVYTVGDQLWVSSKYNSTISVWLSVPSDSNGSRGTGSAFITTLPPGVPTPLRTFTLPDPEGVWTLHVVDPAFDVPIRLLEIANHVVQPRVTSHLLQADSLSLSFDADLADAYDIETCVAPNPPASRVLLSIPASIGTGSLSIQRNGSALLLSVNATFASSFTFWFEIYQPYSYSVLGTGELISRDLRSAGSAPILVQSAGAANTTLTYDTHLRQGRSTVRAFFDNPKGLVVEEADVLVPNERSWLPLDGSCPRSQLNSGTFSYAAHLAGDPRSWPTSLYTMYRVFGVEGVSYLPLRLNTSKTSLVASPWGGDLSDSGITLASNESVTPGAVGIQTSLSAGTIYLISSTYPVQVSYRVNFLGQTRLITQTVPAPYTENKALIGTGLLVVQVYSGSLPARNGMVRITNVAANRSITKTTDTDGVAAFFVPAGSYAASALFANQSKTQNVLTVDGNTTTVKMSFAGATTGSIFPDYLQLALILAAALGVLGNVVVWFFRRRLSVRASR